MKIAQIRPLDVANGVGVRTSIFVSGCTHNCLDCFNKDYQNFNYGRNYSIDDLMLIQKNLDSPFNSGLTLLGGEPFQNCEGLIDLISELNLNGKSIWMYSGYTFEEIMENPLRCKLLELGTVLIDGRFVAELKDLTLKFRGSSNQRVLDIQESLKQNKPIDYYKER